MTGSVTVDQRRRLLAERQFVGPRGRASRTITDVAAGLVLLHSTDPATTYLSLHARTDASSDEVAAALYDERELLRLTTLRRTIFVAPLDVVPLAVGAYNAPMVARLRRQLERWLVESSDVAEATDVAGAGRFLAALEGRVVEHLRANGPTSGTALAAAVPDLRVTFEQVPGKSYSRPTRITSKVLEILAAEGRIARGRPVGGLTSGAWTWSAIGDWLAGGIPAVDPAQALAELLERYLAAFGPATVTDATWWTGLTKTKVRTTLAAIGAVAVDVEDSPEAGWVNADDDLAVLDSDHHPQVALLPGLDSTAMGWKQRSWYVDDDPATGLYDRNGNAGPSVWLDGRVVGAWTQRADGLIATELHEEVDADVHAMIDAEASRVAAWLGDVRVRWRFASPASRRLQA